MCTCKSKYMVYVNLTIWYTCIQCLFKQEATGMVANYKQKKGSSQEEPRRKHKQNQKHTTQQKEKTQTKPENAKTPRQEAHKLTQKHSSNTHTHTHTHTHTLHTHIHTHTEQERRYHPQKTGPKRRPSTGHHANTPQKIKACKFIRSYRVTTMVYLPLNTFQSIICTKIICSSHRALLGICAAPSLLYLIRKNKPHYK